MPTSVTLKGSPVTVRGTEVKAGEHAPDFALNKNLKEVARFADYSGKVIIINSVPSLDTPVCDLQGKRFNKEAAALGEDAVILMVSRDLPPAQARWCGANDATNIVCLSDYKDRTFGDAWGVDMPDLGILARAVFVIGKDGKVAYAEYVPEIAQEPNYDAALKAAKAAMG